MATLAARKPGVDLGVGSGGAAFQDTGDNRLNDGNTSTTFVGVTQNATGDYTERYALDDMPTDFASMLTCTLRINYNWRSQVSNSNASIYAVIRNSAGTVLAAATAAGTFSGGYQIFVSGTTSFGLSGQWSPTGSFNYVNTSATKADWDDAYLELYIARTKAKGGDSVEFAIYEAEVAGTYQQAAPAIAALVPWIQDD